jgi:lysophospholipase L1-like esterase
MTNPPSWRLKVLVPTAVTALTLLVVAVIGEVTVRYRERHRESVPGAMPFLYYRHQFLGFALVRDYSYFGWVHTNPQGFRGARPIPHAKPAGVFRVLAVGGSTTFDTEVSADSAAWPARLERWLRELAPVEQVEVINAGVPGYNMTQDLIRLETELSEYSPDLIILYQGHNDLFQNLRAEIVGFGPVDRHRPSQTEAITPWRRWLEQNSLLYAKLVQKLKRLGLARLRSQPRTQNARSEPGPPPDDGAARFGRMVSLYLAAAQTLNLRVAIPEIVQLAGTSAAPEGGVRQLWQVTVPFTTPETVLLGYQHYNLTLREVSARFRVPFLPMADLGIAGSGYYAQDDPIHFNDRGADLFAEGLARRLIAAHLVPVSKQ